MPRSVYAANNADYRLPVSIHRNWKHSFIAVWWWWPCNIFNWI